MSVQGETTKSRRRTANDVNEYWREQVHRILLAFGAAPLPDLRDPGGKASKKMGYAYRLRNRYVVQRMEALINKDAVGRELDEMVHDFLDQARLQTEAKYWRELNHQYRVRGEFIL